MRDNASPSAEKSYFSEALNWETSAEAQRAKSERRAWAVAGVASTIALTAVIGLALLAPYRRNIPYLFALDKATGNVEFVGAIDQRKVIGYQELLDKHWAQRYVIARESYFYKLLQVDYDTVLNLSGEKVARDYAKIYEGPNARDTTYGPNLEVKVAVLSVQLSRNDVGAQAVVRFSKTTRRSENESSTPPQYFVATMSYEYVPAMTGKEKDLLANPLGYKVTSYRVDAELAQVAPTAQPGTAPQGQ